MNKTVGIFYELPDGRIAYTYGFTPQIIMYYFDDDQGGRSVTQEDFQTWKPRSDLKDFPNARDPRLPYEFDLYWDIKHVSELRRIIETGHGDIDMMKKLMLEHGISC